MKSQNIQCIDPIEGRKLHPHRHHEVIHILKQEEEDRERQCLIYCLERLGPNTIVYEILTFYQYDFSECRDLGLFGYFKLDRLRNMWMIFRTLHLPDRQSTGIRHSSFEHTEFIKTTYINWNKVKNLRIEFTPASFKHLKQFSNLKRLIACQPNGPDTIDEKDEATTYDFGLKFPKLEYLDYTLPTGFVSLDEYIFSTIKFEQLRVAKFRMAAFHLSSKKLKKLTELKLDACTIKGTFFSHSQFSCLTKVSFYNLGFISDGIYKWNPSCTRTLKLLHIHKCKHLRDLLFQNNSFSQLKVLSISYCKSLTGRGWVPCFENLEELRVNHCSEFTDWIFDNHPLKKLRNVGIQCPRVDWKRIKFLMEIKSNPKTYIFSTEGPEALAEQMFTLWKKKRSSQNLDKVTTWKENVTDWRHGRQTQTLDKVLRITALKFTHHACRVLRHFKETLILMCQKEKVEIEWNCIPKDKTKSINGSGDGLRGFGTPPRTNFVMVISQFNFRDEPRFLRNIIPFLREEDERKLPYLRTVMVPCKHIRTRH